MNSVKTAKMLSRYSSGLLSAPEVAQAMLVDLLGDTEIDTKFLTAAELPSEVRRALNDLLHNIQKEGYHWRPFFVDPTPGTDSVSTDDAVKLRRICEALTGV